MADVFNLILHSNLFNFAFFMLIIIVICAKIDVGAVLEKMKDKVASEINNSKSEKEGALNNLSDAKTEYSKLPQELKNISDAAKLKAESLSKQVSADTEQKIANMEKNAESILNAEQKNLTSSLISKLGVKSVEFAKYNIIDELTKNPKLHDKFIEESISKLDEVLL